MFSLQQCLRNLDKMTKAHLEATPSKDLGGYDYQFVDAPPDTLVCKICHCPSKVPHLSVCCGHTFCKSCLVSAKNSAVAKVCPICRGAKFETFPNKQNERLIKSLAVFCTNKGKGCDWQGEVNDITSHLGNSSGCQFVEVSCSNNCGSSVQRQCLANHKENECPRRIVNCQYCQVTGEHHFIENQHKEYECSKFPTACPNECDMTIPRDSIVDHMEVCPCQLLQCGNKCGALYQRKNRYAHFAECPRRKVRCQYCNVITKYNVVKQHYEQCPKLPLPCPNECSEDRIPRESMEKHRKACPLEPVGCSNGCGKDIQRQHFTNHVDNQCPLRKITCQLCDITGEYQYITHQHKDECPKVPLPCPNKCGATILRKNMKAHRKVCPLEVIQCEFHGVGCETRLARRDFKKHHQEKVMEHLVFTKSELVSTKSKLTNAEKQLAVFEKRLAANTDAALAKMEAKLQQKINEIDSNARKRNRELEGRLQQSNWFKKLHSWAAALQSGNDSLPVTIKMTGYARKKRNNESWTSKPFYTNDEEYQMELLVKPAGNPSYDDHGSYMCVELSFTYKGTQCRSYYDEDEYYGFRKFQQFEVQVLNQISDSEHFSETQETCLHSYDCGSWYSREYISTGLLHKNTATCQYLKNDTIFFKVRSA